MKKNLNHLTSYIQWPGVNFEYSGFNYIVLNCNPFVSQKSMSSLGMNMFFENGVEILEMTTPKHSNLKKPKTLYSHETIPFDQVKHVFFYHGINCFCKPPESMLHSVAGLASENSDSSFILFNFIFPVFRSVVHIACKNNTINNIF